jgi:Tfp pilus assembly protein PilO
MKIQLTPKLVALVAASVIGLVALGGWFGLVSPQRSKAESLDAQIADEQSKLNVAKLLARSQQGGKGKTTGAELLAIAMPSSLQMPTILRQVQQLAKSSSVTLESFTPSAGANLAGYQTVPIDVTVNGRYMAVKQFLHKLRVQAGASGGRIHATGRLFDVQRVSLAPGSTETSDLSAAIRLATFVYTGAVPPAETATSAPTDSTSDAAAVTGGTP